MTAPVLICVASRFEQKHILADFHCEENLLPFLETGDFHGETVHLLITGMGKKHLKKRLESYLQRLSSRPRGILIIGISGGCKPGLANGDIFRVTSVGSGSSVLNVPDTPGAPCLPFKTAFCFTSSKPLKTPDEKKTVYLEHSSEIVDMESFFLVRFLKNQEVPIRILRVVSDRMEDILPEIAMVWGAAPALRVFTTLLKEILHPLRCLALIRFNRGVHRACTRLRCALSNPACVKFS